MRRHETLERFAVLIAVFMLTASVTAVSALGVASLSSDSAQSGALHVKKECSPPGFTGQAGSYCTITSSNLEAIGVGSKVFYAEAPGAAGLDSDLYLYTGPGNSAFGHVTLSFATMSGVVRLSGGTGRFRGVRARVVVTYDAYTNLWHWDGRYSFARPDDDD